MKTITPRMRAGFALGTAMALGSVAACFDDTTSAVPQTLGTPEATVRDPSAPFAAAPSALRRLTESQFQHAMVDVFGADVTVALAPDPDVLVEGAASVGSSVSSLSPRGIENLESIAYDIGKQLTSSDAVKARFASCLAGTIDDACLRSIATKYGRRLWRRELTSAELDALVASGNAAGTTLDAPIQSVRFLLAAILQSPEFMYRAELGSPVEGNPTELRYSDAELASRLAFFLWDGPPDDTLLDAAKNGDLAKAAGVSAQVDRMIADPKAARGLRSFADEWLRLRGLQDLSKDTTIFRSFNTEVGPAAREEILLNVLSIALDKKADLRTLLTSRETHVNRKLASLYDVPAPAQAGFARVTLPSDIPRVGLLGTIGFLGAYAHPTGSSPTKRGAYIREALLCQTIPSPPANVNTAIPEVTGSRKTMRDRLTAHQEVAFCAGCHKPIDGVGLALEAFDGAGAYRTTDNGAALDLSGTLDGVNFTGSEELSELVARHPDFPRCVAQNVHRFAFGHTTTDGEQVDLDGLTTSFIASGYRLDQLLRSVATSDSFRIAAAPAAGE